MCSRRLFQSGVSPILDYCGQVWGYKKFPQIDAIQNKATRIFLGVHKFVSIDAINGDMRWTTSGERRKINMVRFWNRLMSLNNTRLPKVILNWDSKCRGNTWSLNIQSIFNEIDQENVVASNLQVSINKWSALFHEIQCNQWSVNIAKKTKLHTYVTFKDTYEVEPYALSFMN